MIKINLVESITDRPTGAAMVEARVANPRIQTLLLAATVLGLFVVGASYDYMSSRSNHETARVELEKQRAINLQMLAVNKEQSDLEKKAQEIQSRIDAIKKLREAQQGPSAVLREIKYRFDSVPGLYLKSVQQKDGELTIKGLSPNEYSVTRFGQSLEFSSGLFTNLNIETQREAVQPTGNTAAVVDPTAPMPEVISFTVKCNYGPKPQNQAATLATSNQVAKK
ncbi:MAG TPA: PilN domain-containing protein [Pyrinomonadaceae bacterium]|nr:PilN domain-containing protein [Pyrinomonadaceae bacterium]